MEESPKVINSWVAGILVAMVISSGATYLLTRSESYKTCTVNWAQNEDGTWTCATKPLESFYCYKFSEPNKDGISTRCYLATAKSAEQNVFRLVDVQINGDSWYTESEGRCFLNGNLKHEIKCDTGELI